VRPEYLQQLKRASRGISADMSPEAIAHRLDILAELDEVARSLQTSQPRRTNSDATTASLANDSKENTCS